MYGGELDELVRQVFDRDVHGSKEETAMTVGKGLPDRSLGEKSNRRRHHASGVAVGGESCD